jgi:hypothetical protein
MDSASSDCALVLDAGLAAARNIGHPVMRARHLAAWARRASAVEAERAVALLPELGDEPAEGAELLVTVIQDRLRRGETEVEPYFSQAVELAARAPADAALRSLNTLSEAAMELGEADAGRGRALLHRLAPAVRALTVPETETQHHRALGCALIGEALLGLDDPEGEALLAEAERLSNGLPARDPLLGFIIGAIADREPERAVRMAATMEDVDTRLDTRLPLVGKLAAGDLRRALLADVEKDAALIEHMRGPEVLVRVAHALSDAEPERARALFERALDGAAGSGAQLRALQYTGVAAAVAALDREWSARIFAEAAAAAREEPEQVRRVTALAVIADEMAEAYPREAGGIFAEAMEEARGLEAIWEYAHVLELVLRPDRSPYLDVALVRPLLDAALARLSDDDPRIPGVFGLPDVARYLLQVDPPAAEPVIRRWLAAAEAAEDPDGITEAALALVRSDEAAGRAALAQVRDTLLHRLDCPAMGMFSRHVAPLDPRLVIELAGRIPDRRERAEATMSAAAALYSQAPEEALALAGALEQPADRSMALLRIFDAAMGTGDRPLPQPLLEDLP